MRSLLACPLLALMVGCATATAPSLVGDDDVPVDARLVDARLIDAALPIDAPAVQTITLNQTGVQTAEVGASIACTQMTTLFTRDNSYYRVFRLADFGVTRPFTPSMVSFGIEQATAGGGGAQTVQVKLHTLSGAMLVQNMINVAGNNVTVPNSGVATINAPIAPAPIIQPSATLVAEIFVPDGLAVGNVLFVGANHNTETAPGYLRSVTCGINEPTTYAGINAQFATVRLILSVTGTY